MRKLSFLAILLFFAAIVPATGHAGVDLPWSTTFDCDDWTSDPVSGHGDQVCDDFTQFGNWVGPTGRNTQILIDANDPKGDGGKGVRFPDDDGDDQGSPKLSLTFNTLQPELWIRWYQRYSASYGWNRLIYDKFLYIYAAPGGNISGAVIPAFDSGNKIRIYAISSGAIARTTHGWSTMFGSESESDGGFHCMEIHIKMDDNTGHNNGVAEMWVDGRQVLARYDMNFSGSSLPRPTGWNHFNFASNQNSVSSSPPNTGYVDYDDMAVSNTGPIDLLYPYDDIPPSAPFLNLPTLSNQ